MPTLVDSLKTAGDMDRLAAVRILGNIGPDARSAVPVLRSLVEDQREGDGLREAARIALLEMGEGAASRATK